MTFLNIKEISATFAQYLKERPFNNRIEIESANGVKVDLFWADERKGVAFLLHNPEESFVLFPDHKIWTAKKISVEL